MYVPSDVRDFAIYMSEEYVKPEDMLLACIKHMSKDDVKDMLISNEYISEKEMNILRVDSNDSRAFNRSKL